MNSIKMNVVYSTDKAKNDSPAFLLSEKDAKRHFIRMTRKWWQFWRWFV